MQGDLSALLRNIAATLATPFAKGLLRAFITHDEQDDALNEARAAFWNARFEASVAMVERAIQRGELPLDTDSRHLLEFAAAPCSTAPW